MLRGHSRAKARGAGHASGEAAPGQPGKALPGQPRPARRLRHLRSVEFLSLAAVAVLVAGLVATTTIVYTRLADELVANTETAIVDRAASVTASIVNVLSLAADEAMNLMASAGTSPDAADRAVMRERLGRIQGGLTGCTGAWIVPAGQSPVIALGTPRNSILLRDWWKRYLDLEGSLQGGSSGNLGIKRNLGFVAQPFRGSTGIGTILPLVVPRYAGTELVMTAFFEIDMTVILSDLQNQGGRGAGSSAGGSEYPLELFFYDRDGNLVETTRNLPLVRLRPFDPATAEVPGDRHSRLWSFRSYLFPKNRTIEAGYKDTQLDLLCLGRVPAKAVIGDVRRVATNVLTVGAAAFFAVLMLGFLLIQALRRARSFEKEQLVARFEALQARINPHFLFNTLDSMIGVVEARDYDTLMRMIRALSSMLHMTVRRTRDIVSLGEELEYVRGYLAIQEVRYRDRFTWRIDVPAALHSVAVCRFTLQPVVENCFTHGVHEGMDGMHIDIAAREVAGTVLIEVLDDGPGCPAIVAESLRESFIRGTNRTGHEGGLFNVHDRIRMSFGAPYGLELVDGARGFGIRMAIPHAAPQTARGTGEPGRRSRHGSGTSPLRNRIPKEEA